VWQRRQNGFDTIAGPEHAAGRDLAHHACLAHLCKQSFKDSQRRLYLGSGRYGITDPKGGSGSLAAALTFEQRT